jgi:hypothetical protein
MSVQRRVFDSTVDPTDKLAWRAWLYSLNLSLDDLVGAINSQSSALPVYADNASALAAKLKTGQFYKTSTGQVMQVY